VRRWLNTPRKPLEASGTSGMKASMNGVLHLSIGDGWWAEGYSGTNGWLIAGARAPGRRERGRRRCGVAVRCWSAKSSASTSATRATSRRGSRWCAGRFSRLPRFAARRMLKDYVKQACAPALQDGKAGRV
jgi:starch phosphorylase